MTSAIQIETKLQGALIAVTDTVEVQSPELYERVGSSILRKFGGVQRAKKTAEEVTLEIDDLANSFGRCGSITAEDALPFDQAPESERARNGYITDQYGMIDNDAETHGSNLIW